MKIELILPNTKIVLMAGFCPALNGLIVGLWENSYVYNENSYTFLNNISIFWGKVYLDSDHGHLAQSPVRLYDTLVTTINSLEPFLHYFVPKTVKGLKFCKKVSPGQSRIYLSEELNVEPFQTPEFNFNFTSLQVENFGFEPATNDPGCNVSIIEQQLIEEEEEEDYFGTSQDRVTPGLVNLDEIVGDLQQRRSKSPSQIDFSESPEIPILSKNGRWFRKSSHQFKFNLNIPNIGPLPPIKSVKSLKYLRKSNSSQELRQQQLLEIDDYKSLGLGDIYKGMQKYIIEQNEDNWMD